MTENVDYTAHIQRSFTDANAEKSKLPEEISSNAHLRGMSTSKIRHFLNNINSLPETNYLEIGCWQGSTLCSAVYGNLGEVYAIDHFVQCFDKYEGQNVKDLLFENLDKFSLRDQVHFFNENCFELDLAKIPVKIDVYFYDGDHSDTAQEKALTYFKPVLADTFIYIVDDWRDRGPDVESGAAEGTFRGIDRGFNQLYHIELPAGDYHVGVGVFVLEKK